MKKCLSIIITAVMIMSMLSCPVSVGAADGENTPVTLIDESFDGYDLSTSTDITVLNSKWGEGATKPHNTIKELKVVSRIEGSNTQVLEVRSEGNYDKSTHITNSVFYRNVDDVEHSAGVYILNYDVKINSLTKQYGYTIVLNEDTNGSSKSGQIILYNKFNSNGVYFNNTTDSTTTATGTDWQSWEIIYNSLTNTIGLKIDGTTAIDFVKMNSVDADGDAIDPVSTIGSVNFVLPRQNNAGDGVYFDNIKLTNQSAAAYDAANTLPETLTYVEGENLTLPTTGLTGSTITWASDNESVINPATGVVTLPTDEAKTVTLTATVSDGTIDAVTQTYNVDIPQGVSDEAYAQQDANAIVVPDYTGQEMIDLPIAGTENASKIVWSSNNSAVMNVVNGNKWDRAYVTVPENTTEVTLNAAVTYNGATVNKAFTYVIYGEDTPLEENFAVNGYSGDINGYNGWTVREITGDDKECVTTGTVKDNVLTVIQGEVVNTTDNTRAQYNMTKNFRQVTGGVAELSIDATFVGTNWKNTAQGFEIELDNVQFQVNKTQLRVKNGDSSWTSYAKYDVAEDGKYTLCVRMNYTTLTADVAVNGVAVVTGVDISQCSGIADSVTVRPIRLQGGTNGKYTLTFDNVNVKRIVPQIQIADIRFTDGNGNAVIGKTNGGLVKGVTVSTNEASAANVQIFAAVSDSEGKISSVAMGSASGLTKDKAVEVTFNKPASLPAENAADAVVSLYAMDSLNNLIPLTYGKLNYNGTSDGTVQFFMCGDSIMCNYGTSTNTVGVGEVLGSFFNEEKVAAGEDHNLAKSGSSTKTFYEEKYTLQENLGSIKNGDYVFLMFGHNDSSAAAKGTDEAYYKLYLTKMINMVRSKGAIPVLMSPVVRYTPYEDDTTTDADESKTLNNESLARYTGYMENLASELNVKYIDVNSMTLNLIQNTYGIGSDDAKAFYILDKNNGAAHDEIEEGSLDTTHLTDTGAKAVAKLITDYMKTNNWLPTGYFAE